MCVCVCVGVRVCVCVCVRVRAWCPMDLFAAPTGLLGGHLPSSANTVRPFAVAGHDRSCVNACASPSVMMGGKLFVFHW